MTRALLGLCLIACTSFAPPQPSVDRRLLPRDGQGLALSPTVAQQFVRMMARGIHDQVEPAACVTSWRVWQDSTHRVNVDVYALTLGETDSADVLDVWWHKTICGDTLPSVHGHVWRLQPVPYPSAMDSLTAANVSRAPFHILLFRFDDDSTFGVRLYGVRP